MNSNNGNFKPKKKLRIKKQPISQRVAKNLYKKTSSGSRINNLISNNILARNSLNKAQSFLKKFNNVRKVSMIFLRVLKAIGVFLISPFGWITVVAIILCILLVAGANVLGKSENGDGCDSFSESSNGVQASYSADKQETANSIAGWLTTTSFSFLGGKPMSINQAAAWIGNMQLESGLNPSASQDKSINSNSSNDAVLAIGSGYNKAVGLLQWDGGRRQKLANYAKGQSGAWNDINVQLSYFKTEMDSSYGAKLVAAGFNDSSKSTVELTDIVNYYFEVSADSRSHSSVEKQREKYATDFLSHYNGGYSSDSGGSCLTATESDADTSSVVSLAISMAYPTWDEGKLPAKPKSAYVQEKALAEQKTGKDPLGSDYYADCGRFVATVMKNTIDPGFPWGPTSAQNTYMSNSSHWKRYSSKSEAQPGDVWVTKQTGHIVIYIGKYNGVDSLANASLGTNVGSIMSANYLNNNLVDTSGRAYWGYHYTG